MNDLMKPLLREIKIILEAARMNVAKQVNNEILITYWKVGELIVRFEQNDKVHA